MSGAALKNKYSVNIPMRYYYKGKFRKGWVNIVNPFRGTWVVGTPGSGKTFSIIEPFIRQHSAKGFAMVVYDYKFPTLAQKLYYHYRINQKAGKVPEGMQVQHHQLCGCGDTHVVSILSSRSTSAILLLPVRQPKHSLSHCRKARRKVVAVVTSSSRHQLSTSLLPASISSVNYEKVPYDENGKCSLQDDHRPKDRHRSNLQDVSLTIQARKWKPAYWLGKYSDMPHILSFLNESYETSLRFWMTDTEVAPFLARSRRPFEE
jgi:hypothetical protein